MNLGSATTCTYDAESLAVAIYYGRTRHAAKSVNRPLKFGPGKCQFFDRSPAAQGAKLGAPKIQGNEAVDGKSAPAGSTKMNNNFTVVDEVAKGRRARNGGHTVRKGRRRIAERNASRPRFRLPAYPIVTSHLRSPSLWMRPDLPMSLVSPRIRGA